MALRQPVAVLVQLLSWLRRADRESRAAGSQTHESGSCEQRLIPGCLTFSIPSLPPSRLLKLILGLD